MNVNQVLDQRNRRFRDRTLKVAVGVSAGVHLTMLVAFFLVPSLLRSEPPRLEYVEVVAIPSADLKRGPKPEPVRRAPKPPPPEPEPETKPPPVEIPEDIPVLQPKEKEKESPKKKPEPVPSQVPSEKVDDKPAEDTPAIPEEPRLPSASLGEVKDTTVAGFDDPNFKFDYYTSRLIQAIGRTWRRPGLERRMDLAIKFRIARDGTVSEIEVVRTSGIPSYDRAGVRALELASPLPPLPVAYRKDSLGATVLLP